MPGFNLISSPLVCDKDKPSSFEKESRFALTVKQAAWGCPISSVVCDSPQPRCGGALPGSY